MQRSIEKEGRNLEEATQNALNELSVDREEVDVEILDDGKSGFLGFGSRNARVRVTPKIIREDTGADKRDFRASEHPEKEAPEAETGEQAPGKEEIAQDMDRAKELLSGLIGEMGMDGTIETKTRDGRIMLNVMGKDSNLLIGKKGQTLDSIQYLLNLMYSKSVKKKKNIIVDVEDYKVRREQRLQSIALEVSDKVKRTKKPIAIAPMNAQDRRIVHLALQDDDSVKTVSKGEGILRKVIVVPKQNR